MAQIIARPWTEQKHFGPIGSSGFASMADWTLERFRELGVELRPQNRLARARRVAVDLHERRLAITADDSETAERAAEAVRMVWESSLVARCLRSPRPETLAKVAKMLKGADLPRLDSNSTPRDTQFELHTAAMFTLGGVPIQTAEPDFQFQRNGVVRGLALKRLSNPKRFRERIEEGADQLEGQGLRGYVGVNVDAFLEGQLVGGSVEEVGHQFNERVARLHGLLPQLADEESALLGVVGLGTVVTWRFGGEVPELNLAQFVQFREFVNDAAERAEAEAFFDDLSRRVDEALG